MRLSTFIPIIVGLAAGVFAVWVGLRAIQNAKQGAKPAAGVAVVVAKSEIPYAVKITEAMLASKAFGSFPVAGRFSKSEDLVGRVTATKIVQGAPILANMLAPGGTVEGAENQIPRGFRAEPVLVEAYTVRDLDPGNRVDVMYSAKGLGGRYGGERTLQTLLQNIEVFSVGQRRIGMEANTKSGKKKSRGRSSASNQTRDKIAVKLLVRTEDVQKLQMADMNGSIKLSMRAAGDDTIYEVPEVEIISATAAEGRASTKEEVPIAEAAAPPKLVPIIHSVRIYEGDAKPRKVDFQIGTEPESSGPASGAGSGGAEPTSSEATEPLEKQGEPD